jgi:hypothetical protein
LPLKHAHEADLTYRFSTGIASQFDVCDQEKTFASILPHKSSICPLLYKAILAVMIKNDRSRSGGHPFPEDEPYLRCAFQELDSVVNGCVVGLVDECTACLLAAAVLIQHHIAVQAPRENPIAGYGLLNMQLIQAKVALEHAGPVGHPVLWASVRQSIYRAIMHQRPPVVARERLNIDPTSTSRSDDYRIWTASMTVLLVDVTCFCFGEDKDLDRYAALVERAYQWTTNKPATLNPVFFRNENKKPFPDIAMVNEHATLAVQYYHLVHILLIAYDPYLRSGHAGDAMLLHADEMMREDVRVVCGIADSRGHINTAHLAASMAIALAGHRFADPSEKQALLDVLIRTEECLNWSTLPA